MTSLYAYYLLDQPILIPSQEIVNPQILSLITKTRIRGPDTFNLPFLVVDDNTSKV
jgi:hypothetical protein